MRGSYLCIQCKPMIFHISLIASIHAPRAHVACSIGIKFLHVLANPSRNAATNEEILEDIGLCVVLLVELLLGCQRNYDPQKISRQSTNLHQKHKTKSNHTIFIYHPRQRKKIPPENRWDFYYLLRNRYFAQPCTYKSNSSRPKSLTKYERIHARCASSGALS